MTRFPVCRTGVIIALCGASLMALPPPTLAQQATGDLKRLSLEQLLQVEVSTASRVAEPWMRTTSATTVITQADIRRSGATTLVDLLRLVPGVHVAQIDSNKWAVGIRGFTDRLSRGMLVMIDGRAVYSPLFAGTYWEVQDTLLDDVERIEIIRGPGGTLWGANAVNGVVNIITRPAAETEGGLLTIGGGSLEHVGAAARYGARLGNETAYRVYAKGFDRGPQFHRTTGDFDAWNMGQAGFRVDSGKPDGRLLTVQGDIYNGDTGQRTTITTYTRPLSTTVEEDASLSGANLLARWRSKAGSAGTVTAQAYYDWTSRDEPGFKESRHTFDLDTQLSARPLGRHSVVAGAGYRQSADDTVAVPIRQFVPDARTVRTVTGFAQDHFDLVTGRLGAVVGAKVEHNSYSGFEIQPSARLLWTPSARQTITASVARAVRTPSRVEEDYVTGSVLNPNVPFFLRLAPNDGFEAEKLTAYELGYRVRPIERALVVVNGFFNHHQDTLSTAVGAPFAEATPPPPHLILPVQFKNALHGNSHGLEISSDVRLTPYLRWTSGYSWLRVQLTEDPGEAPDASQEFRAEGGSPEHQFFNTLSLDLPRQLELDWTFRYVGALPSVAVPSYNTSDVRLGWNVLDRLTLSLVGTNLHEAHHLEFYGGATGNVEIRRAVYARAAWRW